MTLNNEVRWIIEIQTDRIITVLTWYRANHELLISRISWVGFWVPGLKSVSGGDGSFCRFTGDGFLRVGLNGTCPRQWRPGNVMLSLHWLQRFLLSNWTVAYLFDRSALVHRGIVAQQIGNPKGDLVYRAAIWKIYHSKAKNKLLDFHCIPIDGVIHGVRNILRRNSTGILPETAAENALRLVTGKISRALRTLEAIVEINMRLRDQLEWANLVQFRVRNILVRVENLLLVICHRSRKLIWFWNNYL